MRQAVFIMVLLSTLATPLTHLTARPGPRSGIVRGIYCHPGEAISNRPWGLYGQGYALAVVEREPRLPGGEGAHDLREIGSRSNHGYQIPRLEHGVSMRDQEAIPPEHRADDPAPWAKLPQ